jgi:hypothetical protein
MILCIPRGEGTVEDILSCEGRELQSLLGHCREMSASGAFGASTADQGGKCSTFLLKTLSCNRKGTSSICYKSILRPVTRLIQSPYQLQYLRKKQNVAIVVREQVEG